MLDLSPTGIEKIDEIKKRRAEILTSLTAQTPDITKKEQIDLIRKFNDEFELAQHQMHLFNGMSACLWLWGGALVTNLFLPLPDFSSYFLILGLVGSTLAHFCIKDFHIQLTELKTIYNWCLKQKSNNHYQYDGVTDNTDKLSHPEIQRMIHLLAPMCSREFMQAWPKMMAKETPGFFGILTEASHKAYKSFFSPQPGAEELRKIKLQVEANALRVSAFEGLGRAIHYFTTNMTFRERIIATVPYIDINTVQRLNQVMTSRSPSPT